MKGSMSLLNDLVRQVRETHSLTLEAVALGSDISTSAINRYELGQVEVPFRYVRSLFSMTGDLRILRYFSPQIAEVFCCIQHQQQCQPVPGNGGKPKRTPPAGDPADLLPRELDLLDGLAKTVRYVQRITADGRIDASDDSAIGNVLKGHERMREVADEVDRALIALRDRVKD